MSDLPWSPRLGKTALRLVASAGGRVLCQDSAQPIRALWTADGRLIAVGGEALRLDGTPRAACAPSPHSPVFRRAFCRTPCGGRRWPKAG